jgi:hypothetical protein
MVHSNGTYNGSPASLSERIKLLREGISFWRRLSWTTDITIPCPKDSDNTRFRVSRDVVLAYSTIAGATEKTFIEIYRIPSVMRNIEFERTKWSVPFRVSSAVADSTRDLVLLFEELEIEHHEVVHTNGDEVRRSRCVSRIHMSYGP